jgi:exosortase family protein XrtM
MPTQRKMVLTPPRQLPNQESGSAGQTTASRATLWRLVFFLAIFASLQGCYATAKGTWIERVLIDKITVQSAAWIISQVDPSSKVEPVGSRLRSPTGGLNILNGCEGTDILFLLIAAMLVAPQSWRARFLGIVLGVAFIFALNQARVVALFYAFRHDRAIFEILHGTVAPLLLIIATGAFFVVWLNHGSRRPLVARLVSIR